MLLQLVEERGKDHRCAAASVISELKIRTQSNPNLGDYLKDVKGVDFTQSGLDSYNSARGFNSSFQADCLL